MALQQTLHAIVLEKRHIQKKVEAASKENLPEKVQRHQEDLTKLHEHELYIQEEPWSPHFRFDSVSNTF